MPPAFTHLAQATKAAASRDKKWQQKHISKTGKKANFPGMFSEQQLTQIVEQVFTALFKKAHCRKKKCSETMFGGIVDPRQKSLAPAGDVQNYMETKKMKTSKLKLTKEQLFEIVQLAISESDLLKRLGQDHQYLSKQKDSQPQKPQAYADRLAKIKKPSRKPFKESEGKDNPWAICNDSVGSENSDKLERCVKAVKSKK